MDLVAYLVIAIAFLQLVASATHSLTLVASRTQRSALHDADIRRYVPLGTCSGIGALGCIWWATSGPLLGLGAMIFGLWPATIHLWHLVASRHLPDSALTTSHLAVPWLLPLVPVIATFFVCNGFSFTADGPIEVAIAAGISFVCVAPIINDRLF